MKVNLCIQSALALLVTMVEGGEIVMNKLLRDHALRTAAKTNAMTMDSALEIVRVKHNVSLEYLETRFYPRNSRSARSLRQKKAINALQLDEGNATGYAAVASAMKMLNSMIKEAQGKYEDEIEQCCSFDRKMTALIQTTREQKSVADKQAAICKGIILQAESCISLCEMQIPKLGEQLEDWNSQCKSQISDLDKMLTTVTGDLNVVAQIIEASKCENETQATMLLYQCSDDCGEYEIVDSGEPMTPRMHELALELVSESRSSSGNKTMANLTTTTPAPRTIKRSRPCKAPRNMDPASAKCTIKNSPQCSKLVEKFFNIQTGLLETQRELEMKRSGLLEECANNRLNLESQISAFEIKLKDCNGDLAHGTACNAEAIEESRQKAKQLVGFMKNYEEMTEECHNNYDQLEAEICALTKIRGDVFNKLKGNKDPAFFTDCKVSEWVEVEPGCSVSCGGGTRKMQRTIEVYPVGGSECPALDLVEECNLQKCPIDCKLGDWSGWSDCSSKCGGGVQDRNRLVLVRPLYQGEACGDTEETQSCNPQSCDADCILSDWTAWSNCSKPCNQGHITRIRSVIEPSIGGGTCPAIDGPVRLQKKFCNTQACPVTLSLGSSQLLQCRSKRDLVVLIDGSGSVRKTGWKVQLQATRMLMEAFKPAPNSNSMGIIVYSGPKWLCDYYQCMGYTKSWYFRRRCSPKKKFDCGTNIVSQLTTDKSKLQNALNAVKFPSRTTFTSKALAAVESVLNLGQKDADSVVVVMTDGYPADKKGTRRAARKLNRKAKVIWVPITKYAPLKEIRKWATDPENVIPVKEFSDLTEKVINDVVATSCNNVVPMANPLTSAVALR